MEVVFSNNACGGLKCARLSNDGVYDFNLALSVGDISEDVPGPLRREALRALEFSTLSLPGVEEWIAQCAASAAASLEDLLRRRTAPVRIWYSSQPDELCGLCWLLSCLDGQEERPVSLVRLPRYEQRDDGVLVSYNGWGELRPQEWKRFLALERPASPALIRAAANRWKELQAENAPLRAEVNGRLSSVPEDFYDGFLRRELARMPEEFRESELIGNVLGRCRLGIGDGLLAGRIEAMLSAGELEPVTQAEAGVPSYRRVLRKRAAL